MAGPVSSMGYCRQILRKLYQKRVVCSLQCNASRSLLTDNSNTAETNTGEAVKYTNRNYVSKMYQNFGNVFPSESSGLVCKSHKLLLYAGLIQQCHFGGYNLLPLGQRVQDKLVKIIDQELQAIGCQKMSMTTLIPAKFWRKTGRWDMGRELFRLTDRKRIDFCLAPTHEEVITNILATGPTMPYKRLPVKMYQITRKFRDENSPKYGFLRSREFEMKDLYTFDASLEDAADTYKTVSVAYTRILDKLGLDYDIVTGSTGNIGGTMSHEFQVRADIGEDRIHVCKKCGFAANAETTEAKENDCTNSPCELIKTTSIEVGHSFLLGTKYSEPFEAKYSTKNSKRVCYEMGCYGLGVSRIMQTCVEVLSREKEIVWPQLIAPYQFCIIPMESKKECLSIAESMSDELNKRSALSGEVVIDDRDKRVTFRRFEAKAIGYTYIITIKDKALSNPALFEITDTRTNKVMFLRWDQLMDLASTITTV